MNSLVGSSLGSYQILEQIGMGGMATIYRAYQNSMDRYVAIKVLPKQMATEDTTFLGRFQQEAKTIAKLEHRNILPVYDYGEAEGYTYLVMRYVDAGTLKDLIASGPVPIPRAVKLIRQVADALHYAHEQGVIHRDVKPSNVLLDAQDHAYLMDFGIAKLLSSSARFTGTDMMIGTPAYMSPEQAQGAAADRRSDVYSLGVMLYEMVTGQAPYEAETPMAVLLKHIQAPLPPPRTIRADLPGAVERIILRAMAKKPEERYQTAVEMADALENALREVPTEERPATRPLRAEEATMLAAHPSAGRRVPAGVWVIGGVVLVGVIILALVLAAGGTPAPIAEGTSAAPVQTTGEVPQTPPAAMTGTGQAGPTGESPTAVAVAAVPGWSFYVSTSGVHGLLPVGDVVYAATDGGLVRWTLDGQAVLITPAHGLPMLRIDTMAAAPDGSLWLGGTLTGIAHLTLDGDAVSDVAVFTPEDGLGNNIVSGIAIDGEGNVWAAVPYGGLVNYYDGQTWHDSPPVPLGDALYNQLGDHATAITRTSNGMIWVGTDSGGVIRLDPGADSWRVFPGEANAPVHLIYEDRDRNVWISQGVSLWRSALEAVDEESAWQAQPQINEGCPVSGMIQAADDTYWLTCDEWVIHFQPDDGRRATYNGDDGVPGYTTGAILEDAQGRIWIGTDNGIGVFDGRRWITFRRENDAPPGQRTFLRQTGDGRIWAVGAEWDSTVWSFDPASGAWDTYNLGLYDVNDFAVDDRGESPVLWFSSESEGLIRYSLADGSLRTYTGEDGFLTDYSPSALALDGAGNLWIGVLEGVYRLNLAEETFTLYSAASDGQPLDMITRLYTAPDGVLWAGHRGWDSGSRMSVADSAISAKLDTLNAQADRLSNMPLVNAEPIRATLGELTGLTEAIGTQIDQMWSAEGAAQASAAQTLTGSANSLLAVAEQLVALTTAEGAAESGDVRGLAEEMRALAGTVPALVASFSTALLSEWAAEPNWVYRYDAGSDAFQRLAGANSPSQSEAPALADLSTDGQGGLLVTVNYDALYHWDGQSWEREGGALQGSQLSAVTVGPDGRVWVIAPETGLFTRDEYGWFLVPWQEGMGTPELYDLLVVQDGTLWLGTSGGLIRLVGEP